MNRIIPKSKIAFIIGYYPLNRGGAELQAYYIAKGLKSEFDIFYISIGHEKDEVIIENGIKIYLLKTPKLFDRFTMYSLIKVKLYAILDIEKPNLFYQSIGFAVTGLIARYSLENDIKFIFSVQRDDEAYSYKYKLLLTNILKFIDDIFRVYGIKNADHIITQSHLQKKLIEQNFKRTSDLILYSFAPLPDNFIKQYNMIKVVWIANFKQMKQPHIFIDLVSKINTNNLINNNVEFIMAGRAGNDKYCNDVFKRIKNSQIKYLGEISNDAVNDLLIDSHILVNTSIFEGFANVFVQAWLRGVVVITLNADPDNLIKTNNLGFHSKTQIKLLEDIIYLINNQTVLINYSNNASKYSHENLGPKNIEKVKTLFDSIIGNKKNEN